MGKRQRANTYVVLDVETSGLNSNRDRVVEIAVVKMYGTRLRPLRVIDSFETLIAPDDLVLADQKRIGAQEIHGIVPEMLAEAPTFRTIAQPLANFLHGSIYVAHNAHFDLRFLQHEFSLCRFQMLPGLGCDTYVETGLSLSKACAEHEIINESPHSAGGDAAATAALFRALSLRRVRRRFKPITFTHRPVNPGNGLVRPGPFVRRSWVEPVKSDG